MELANWVCGFGCYTFFYRRGRVSAGFLHSLKNPSINKILITALAPNNKIKRKIFSLSPFFTTAATAKINRIRILFLITFLLVLLLCFFTPLSSFFLLLLLLLLVLLVVINLNHSSGNVL